MPDEAATPGATEMNTLAESKFTGPRDSASRHPYDVTCADGIDRGLHIGLRATGCKDYGRIRSNLDVQKQCRAAYP
jgi:hypothetical protein